MTGLRLGARPAPSGRATAATRTDGPARDQGPAGPWPTSLRPTTTWADR